MNHYTMAAFRIRRAVKVECKRAVFSSTFCSAVLLLLAWQYANTLHALPNRVFWMQADIVTTFNTAVSAVESMGRLLLPIAAVIYSWSGELDKQSGFKTAAAQRVGVRAYGVAKVVAVALSAFLAVVLAEMLLVMVLAAMGMPALPRYPLDNTQYLLLAQRSVVGFILVRQMISGMAACLSAVFALMAGAFLHNRLAAMLTPLLGYYFWDVIGSILNIHFQGYYMEIVLFLQPFQDPVFSAIWAVVYTLTLTVLCGRAYCRKLEMEERA